MDVVSTGPLGVARLVWQPRPGVHVMTVACKATFRLEPGVSPLAAEPVEVTAHDQHWNGDEAGSVYMPSDLAPYKRVSDVILVGSAFAPFGRPVRALTAAIEVGEVRKAIDVRGERAFSREGRLLEGSGFSRMSLRWERAAGGPEGVNPVGVRFDAPRDAEGRNPVPNLQPPWTTIARRGDTFEPIGFGPVAAFWPGRAWHLGRHLAGWSHRRWPERPVPTDIDPRYFNAAPPDQQTDSLLPDPRIVLENLHPEHPRLVTTLVRLRPLAVVERRGRVPESLELACDTLWIDTDRGVCTLTFRGSTSLVRPDEPGRVVISLGESVAPPRRSRAMTVDTTAYGAFDGASLPFLAPRAAAAPAPTFGAPPLAAPAVPQAPGFDLSRTLDDADLEDDGAPAGPMPFGGGARALPRTEPPPPPPTRSAWGHEPTSTIALAELQAPREPLRTAPPPALAPRPETIPPPGAAEGEVSPAFWQRLVRAPEPTEADDGEHEDALETLRPPQDDLPAFAVPAFTMPPLPRIESFGVPGELETVRRTIDPVSEPPPDAAPAPTGPDALPVAAYAAVKAAFWHHDGAQRHGLDEALRALGIDEDAYRAAEDALHEALAEEARAGRATLARAVRAAIRGAVRDREGAPRS